MNYDFSILDPFEFEQLICDLFSQEYQSIVESFTSGPDQGIDLRHICKDTKSKTILQCKRYGPDKYSKLKSSINEELPKISKLCPNNYKLITSVNLTPKRKSELFGLLKSWCESESDILGRQEINTLLRKHPTVLKNHFKLWLSSTEVLEQIVHSKIFNLSDSKIESAKHELGKIIVHDGFNKCSKILDENNHVLIAGDPGIGKTTLANFISCKLLKEGYQVIFVSTDIDDAWEILHQFKYTNKNPLIVYDDFLDQSEFSTNKRSKNEDKRIVDLIEKCRASKNLKLILTTREYILEEAKQQSGGLNDHDEEIEKFTIRISDYTTQNRAKILFNHLYFSELSDDKLKRVVESKIYKDLIISKNFNPRIVATVCNSKKSREIEDEKYIQYLKEIFENPELIWERPFRREISQTAQKILLILLTLNGSVTYSEIKKLAKKSYAKTSSLAFANDFSRAFKQIEGNFTITQPFNDEEKRAHLVEFANPSIEEFLTKFLRKNSFCIHDIECSIVYFNQVYKLVKTLITKEKPNEEVSEILNMLLEKLKEVENQFSVKLLNSRLGNETFSIKESHSIFHIVLTKLIIFGSIHTKLPDNEKEKLTDYFFWKDAIAGQKSTSRAAIELFRLMNFITDSELFLESEKIEIEKTLKSIIMEKETLTSFLWDADDVDSVVRSLTNMGGSLNLEEEIELTACVEEGIVPDLLSTDDIDQIKTDMEVLKEHDAHSTSAQIDLAERIECLEEVDNDEAEEDKSLDSKISGPENADIDIAEMFSELAHRYRYFFFSGSSLHCSIPFQVKGLPLMSHHCRCRTCQTSLPTIRPAPPNGIARPNYTGLEKLGY